MQLIPVLDIKDGIVVHAKLGLRTQYAPIQSPLCASSAVVDVINAFLALAPFKIVYIADLNKDTLIYARKISVSLLNIKLDEGDYKLNKVQIDNAKINFVTDTAGVMNLTALLDKISQDTVPSSDSSRFALSISKIICLIITN